MVDTRPAARDLRRLADHDNPYQKKFLVVVDESPDCDRAVTFAAYRVSGTGGTVVSMIGVAKPEFSPGHGVEDVLRAEALEEAEDAILDHRSRGLREIGDVRWSRSSARASRRGDRARSPSIRGSPFWRWRRRPRARARSAGDRPSPAECRYRAAGSADGRAGA